MMPEKHRLIDISPRITEKTAVFPGDTRPRREILAELSKGDAVTLSTLHATVHLGAHADGPNHYALGGRAIDEQPLELYVGRCQVIRVDVPGGRRIGVDDLHSTQIDAERVLIATGSYPDPDRWTPEFNGLEPELVDFLAARSVRLVGIDTPSVDSADSKDLPAHSRFFANNMAIIEGLILTSVEIGFYELIALPLKLGGFDGSPIRAILRGL